MKKTKLLQGDFSIRGKEIPDNSIDCILTDPPYGIEYISNHYKRGLNPHSKLENDDSLQFPINEMWRLIKKTGSIFCFYSHKVPIIDKRVKNVII